MAPLRYAAKFDPFLIAPGWRAWGRNMGSNFAIWQPCVKAAALNIPFDGSSMDAVVSSAQTLFAALTGIRMYCDNLGL